MYPYTFYPYFCPCVYYCPFKRLVKHETEYEEKNEPQYRKSKRKKNKIYVPEIFELVSCFNPAILNNKQFKCVTGLNARKIVKQMLNSILECETEECRENYWYYFYQFFNN